MVAHDLNRHEELGVAVPDRMAMGAQGHVGPEGHAVNPPKVPLDVQRLAENYHRMHEALSDEELTMTLRDMRTIHLGDVVVEIYRYVMAFKDDEDISWDVYIFRVGSAMALYDDDTDFRWVTTMAMFEDDRVTMAIAGNRRVVIAKTGYMALIDHDGVHVLEEARRR